MKKKHRKYNCQEENAFALSTGDLMAGLLFIFILLLMGALLHVQEKAERDEEIVKKYDKIKTQLYIDLEKEFKEDLKIWNAVIDSTNLSIRFQEPSTLFAYDQAVLQPKFQDILKDFFPRYLNLISSEQYKENIEEIRIEGHTDSQGSYEYNMKLSQDRTRSVLSFCLQMVSEKEKEWTIARITANGLSSSHLIYNQDGTENKDLSRRVEFRIRTNAEKQLEEIAEKRFNF